MRNQTNLIASISILLSYSFVVGSIRKASSGEVDSVVTNSLRYILGNIDSELDLVKCSENITIDNYERYLQVYNKLYLSRRERNKRFPIFRENLKTILKSKLDFIEGESSYSSGINQFTDLDDDEFKRYEFKQEYRQNYYANDSTHKANQFILTESLPPSLANGKDWRYVEKCNLPPRQQGDCGSCWSIAVMYVLESMHCLSASLNPKEEPAIRLSPQEMIDCYKGHDTIFGCKGGFIDGASAYMVANKIAFKEECYRYRQRREYCKRDKIIKENYDCVVQLEESGKKLSVVSLKGSDEMVDYLNKTGPIVGNLLVTKDFIRYFKGILQENDKKGNEEEDGHSLMIVGFGNEDSLDYWLVKNTWGKEWGIGGYGKIVRGKNAFRLEELAIGITNLLI